MAYNKFKTKAGVVLLDLTNDDVTPETLVKGITAHNRHGEIIKGTYEPLVPMLQEKSVTENGEVLPDERYDGLSKVTVNVPIPEGYIQPNGTLTVTENGIHNVIEFASVSVNVPIKTLKKFDGTVVIE